MQIGNLTLKFRQKKNKGYVGSGSESLLLRRISGTDYNDDDYLETYSKSLYVFACVSKIAEKVGSINFKLNKITNGEGDTKEVYNHPALDLIYKVNPFQTKSEFLEIAVSNFLLSGNSFIWKLRNERGQVAELWNLRPDKMTIVTDPDLFIKEYVFRKDDGKEETFEPQDIIHLKIPSPLNAYRGMSPIAPAQMRVQTEEQATKHQRDLFLNDARPSAILTSDKRMNEKQMKELRASWEQRHKGEGKSSNVGVLEGGIKYQQISLSPKELDWIESMKFTRDDILVAYKVPKPIVAVLDDVNRANSETALAIFLGETIKPLVSKITEKLNEQFITPEYGEEYILDFVDPTPQNRDILLKEYQAGVDNWITPNEIRQELGKEPIKGGDNLLRPMSSVPIGEGFSASVEKSNKPILRGKRQLRKRFQLKNQIFKEIIKTKEAITKKIKRSGSLMFSKEKRIQYWEYKNKLIDKKTALFKSKVKSQSKQQAERFIKKLNKIKKADILAMNKNDIRKLFDIKEENQILTDFAMPYYLRFFEEEANDALAMIRIGKPIDMGKLFSLKQEEKGKIYDRLKARAKFFAKSVNDTTLDGLTDTLSEGISANETMAELTSRVSETYSGFEDYRAELIARTEMASVSNDANIEAFKQSEVVNGKEWVAVMDDRTRDEHAEMNGEIVKLEESFSNGLDAPDEPNCRCVVAPAMIWI